MSPPKCVVSCVVKAELPSLMAAFLFRVWMLFFFSEIGLST